MTAKAAIRSHRAAVHVVEPHALAMGKLRGILKGFPRAEFHGDLPSSLASDGPLILVADAATLWVSLGELLRLVRLRCPKASVIVLNSEGHGDYLMELLHLGVAGFVAHHRAAEELAGAIDTVARGGVWIDANALREFNRQKLLLAESQGCGLLTEREMAVLGLLKRGFCNKEIAAALRISIFTVKFHLKNIFAKLGVHDRRLAVEWAKGSAVPIPALGNGSSG